VSDSGSTVVKMKSKSKKRSRQIIDNSSDEENGNESIDSRSVTNGMKTDVERTRSFLWAEAVADVQAPHNSR
jgi:hypothetical protein